MNWLSDNLQILATLGSALAVYIFIRIGSRKDVKEVEKRMDKFDSRLERIEEKLQTLDSRISRIEGQLIGPPNWEPKVHNREEK